MQISKFPLWLCALTLCGGITLHAEDTAAQAAARAALMQKMNELGGNTATTPETTAPAQAAPSTPAPAETAPAKTETPAVTTPAPATTAPAAAATTAPAMEAPMTTNSGDTAAQAAARAAMEQKMQQLGGNAPATTSPSATSSSAAPIAAAPIAAATAGERQITAPPPPVNMSKAQKLHWLLSLYESNQISPKQYQEQRAAILADH